MVDANLFTLDSDLTDTRKLVYQGPVHQLAQKEGYQSCERDGKPVVGNCHGMTHWVYDNGVRQGDLGFDINSSLELLTQKGLSDGWTVLSAQEDFPRLRFNEYIQDNVGHNWIDSVGKYSTLKGALRMNLSAAIYGPKRYSNEIDLVGIEPGLMSRPPAWGAYDFSRKFLFVTFDFVLGKNDFGLLRSLNTVFDMLGELSGIGGNNINKALYNSQLGIVGVKTNVQSQKDWALEHFVETLDKIVVEDTFKTALTEKYRLMGIERGRGDYGFTKDPSFLVSDVLSCEKDPLNGKMPHTLEEFKASFVWNYYRPALEKMREVVDKDQDMKTLVSLI